MSHSVFISYSTKNTDKAIQVREFLENNGVQCWMAPRDLSGGNAYNRDIPKAIDSCSYFILIASKKASESRWVQSEINRAFNNNAITLIPFDIENFGYPEEWFNLDIFQHIDAVTNFNNGLQLLLKSVDGGKKSTNGVEKLFKDIQKTAGDIKDSVSDNIQSIVDSNIERVKGSLQKFQDSDNTTESESKEVNSPAFDKNTEIRINPSNLFMMNVTAVSGNVVDGNIRKGAVSVDDIVYVKPKNGDIYQTKVKYIYNDQNLLVSSASKGFYGLWLDNIVGNLEGARLYDHRQEVSNVSEEIPLFKILSIAKQTRIGTTVNAEIYEPIHVGDKFSIIGLNSGQEYGPYTITNYVYNYDKNYTLEVKGDGTIFFPGVIGYIY